MTLLENDSEASTAKDASGPTQRLGWSGWVSRRAAAGRLTGIIIAIVITAAVFQTQNSGFLQTSNILLLIQSMAPLAILAFGETFVLVSGEIDLSLGSIYGLGAMGAGELWLHGTPFWLAGLAGLGIGGAIGLINAFIVTIVRVNSFVTTLGMLNLAQGLTYLISHSSSISPSNNLSGFNLFNSIGNTNIIGQVPVQVAWLVGVGIVMWFLLHRSLFGFRLAAIGGNPAAARAAHLPAIRYKFFAFGLAGVCAALGGLIDFSLVGSTDPSSGSELTFPVFAAVIIGGASLSGGRGSIIGTVVGALLLEALTNGLTLLGVGTFAQLLFVGGIIIIAVAIDRWTSDLRGRADVQL